MCIRDSQYIAVSTNIVIQNTNKYKQVQMCDKNKKNILTKVYYFIIQCVFGIYSRCVSLCLFGRIKPWSACGVQGSRYTFNHYRVVCNMILVAYEVNELFCSFNILVYQLFFVCILYIEVQSCTKLMDYHLHIVNITLVPVLLRDVIIFCYIIFLTLS